MSFLPNLPPSVLVKQNDDESKSKPTNKDFKKIKELEEARKAAQVPAMKDEHGNDINPHIPQYIMQAPWYLNSTTPTLRHQRLTQCSSPMEGLKSMIDCQKAKFQKKEKVVSRWSPDSCENCGEMGHKQKQCLEVPRRRMAKYETKAIKVRVVEPTTRICAPKLSYDAKRDRYRDYDNSDHSLVIERYNQKEELRKQNNAKELEEKLKNCNEGERKAVFLKAGEDENRTGEDMDMPGQKFDAKQRQSIRNLRLREDTAIYLMNLHPDSAYYDPKTRAMRGNPYEHTGKSCDEVPFAGDNYVRYEGDTRKMMDAQVLCWEMSKKGINVHVQADPTRVELLSRQFLAASKEVKSKINSEILATYGGEEYLEGPPPEIIYGCSEAYYEYDLTGRQMKGPQRQLLRSRYDEDVYRYSHTSVWGSYWSEGMLGYKCCQSMEKMSCCVGAVVGGLSVGVVAEARCVDKVAIKRHADSASETSTKRLKRRTSSESSSSSSSSSSDNDEADYEQKVQLEMANERKRVATLNASDRSRAYNSNYGDLKAPNEAQMEAYRRLKTMSDDPMSKYI